MGDTFEFVDLLKLKEASYRKNLRKQVTEPEHIVYFASKRQMSSLASQFATLYRQSSNATNLETDSAYSSLVAVAQKAGSEKIN